MSAWSVRLASIAVALTLVVTLGARRVAAQDQLIVVPVRVAEVMSNADRERTGIDRLTPEQRFALDTWLTRYTAELRAALSSGAGARARSALTITSTGVRAAGVSGPSTEANEELPVSAEANTESDQPVTDQRRTRTPGPVTAPPGARVVSTPDEGTYVRLGDGTLWEVYLPDRTATVTWRRGDYVAVSPEATASGDYDHVLVDTSARSRALARFVDVVSRRRR
jgi:hypothetical protein